MLIPRLLRHTEKRLRNAQLSQLSQLSQICSVNRSILFQRTSHPRTVVLHSTRTMSSAATHPISSSSDPARPAEGLNPVTPGASDASKAAAHKEKAAGQQKGDKKDKKDQKGGGASGGSLELDPPPEFFAERLKIYDEYKAKYDKWVSGWSSGQTIEHQLTGRVH